jgi:mannose-6-phosphate isomerase-like protein (cupin superfamily)
VSRHKSFVPAVLLRGGDSAGAVSMIENRVPPRWEGPPLHHHDFDEAFYVLAGELTFQLGARLFSAEAGRFAFARGGVHHTLANRGDEEARYLLVCTPAGFERYFARLAAEEGGVDVPDWALQPTPHVTTVGPAIGR